MRPSTPEQWSKFVFTSTLQSTDVGISDPITYAQAQKLEYFQACLKEAMRLQPAVGMHLPRSVPSGGAVLAGRFFPAGSVVGVSPKLVHRTKEAYGSDAVTFRPDRWLTDDAEELKELNKNNLAFGSGSRSQSFFLTCSLSLNLFAAVCIGVSRGIFRLPRH